LKVMLPLMDGSNPHIVFSNVVFPLPFRPFNPINSPAWIDKVKFAIMGLSAYPTDKFSICKIEEFTLDDGSGFISLKKNQNDHRCAKC